MAVNFVVALFSLFTAKPFDRSHNNHVERLPKKGAIRNGVAARRKNRRKINRPSSLRLVIRK
jgi:hypothetical protein